MMLGRFLGRVSVWVALAFTLVFLASLRYGVNISLSSGAVIGLAGGGVRFQLRGLPVTTPVLGGALSSSSSRVPIRTTPAPRFDHDPLYFYRHHFDFVWGYTDYALTASPGGSRSWELPLWPMFVLSAGYLAWRRFWRVPPGHCRACRYDLRGLTTGVCPECGARSAAPSR
jgi:hypothetical protein